MKNKIVNTEKCETKQINGDAHCFGCKHYSEVGNASICCGSSNCRNGSKREFSKKTMSRLIDWELLLPLIEDKIKQLELELESKTSNKGIIEDIDGVHSQLELDLKSHIYYNNFEKDLDDSDNQLKLDLTESEHYWNFVENVKKETLELNKYKRLYKRVFMAKEKIKEDIKSEYNWLSKKLGLD